MAWQQPGGDWTDAKANPYGQMAFATAQTGRLRAGQAVALDMTPLVIGWQNGVVPPGGVFLTNGPGAGGGRTRFHSRESEDGAKRPTLRIVWQDGRIEELKPLADASLNCSTTRPLGQVPSFAVGRDSNAILLFPFKLEPSRRIREARLELFAERSSPARTISVFSPIVPAAAPQVVEPGFAKSFPADKGIEKHPSVLYVQRFESDAWTKSLPPSRGSNAELTDSRPQGDFAPLDGRALQVTVRRGRNQALNAHFRFAAEMGNEPEEMHFRYALRLNSNWDPRASGGKLPGFSGTYGRAGWGGRRSNGSNGWVAQGAFLEQPDAGSAMSALRGVGSYVYHADMKGDYGNLWGWNLGPGGMLEKGRWYSVEQFVRMNTPGQNDGVLKAWIDGVLVFTRNDLRFRDIPILKIESLWMNVWYGGTDPAPQDLTLYIDNLVIAREYIGPFTRQ
jgi:hypothetical protein